MKQKNKGTKSIIVALYISMIVVLIIIFGILLMNSNFNKEIAYDCLMDKTDLYTEFIDRELININQELKMMYLNEMGSIKKIPFKATAKDGKYYELWRKLEKINHNKEANYNYKYTFFEYGYNADVLIMNKAIYFKNTVRTNYIMKIISQLRYNCENKAENVVWDFISDNGKDYILGSLHSEGKIVGCLINLDDLIGGFEITNLGYEGFLLFEKQGKVYSSTTIKDRKDVKGLIPQIKEEESERTKKYAWYTYHLQGIGNIKIVTLLSDGVLEKVNILQNLLVLTMVLIVMIIFYMIWYLYAKVLNPMRKFVTRLENPELEVCLNERNNDGPLELVYANDKFKQMYREIQSLRIDLYEKELFEKTTMLEYAQEQMKPHFFLNCMSVVQSMAELNNDKDIVNILGVLSEYMRYVLKDNFEMRYISDEINHLKDYMEIQSLCKPGMFKYEAIVEDDLQKCKILPLIFQVFVENSIKYGLVTNQCIEITVYVTSVNIDNNKYLYIVISDTGNGFPQDIIDKIERDEPIFYNGCEHIGIRNTIKRIKMKYGDKSSVTFSNMRENYGAVVEIILPLD